MAIRDDQWQRHPGPASWSGSTCGADGGRQSAVRRGACCRATASAFRRRDLRSASLTWRDVHPRFTRWATSIACQKVFLQLSRSTPTPSADDRHQLARAYQHIAGAQRQPGEDQRSPDRDGRLSSKIHALVDALRILGRCLPGRREPHDLLGADQLLPSMQADTLIADKAFDADERVIAPLAAAGKTAVIPPKAYRPPAARPTPNTSTARLLIENFFAKLKQFRAIAARSTRPRATSSPPSPPDHRLTLRGQAQSNIESDSVRDVCDQDCP